MPNLQNHIATHEADLFKVTADSDFLVFLCGPSLKESKPSARLRRQLKKRLEQENFEVVLGEDDGLEDARLNVGLNAQDNELEFIRKHCQAVIVIADSVGAFCELGLFSWHRIHKAGLINSETDFILLVDQEYQKDKSYLNEGPFSALKFSGAHAQFVNLAEHSCEDIVARLKHRRILFCMDRSTSLD